MDEQLLKEKLDRGIPSHVLLAKARFLNSESRESPEITDPRNLPFYYFLGLQSKARSVVQIGAQLGLPAYCFLQGSKHPERWVVLDEGEVVYARTVLANVRHHLRGEAEYWVGGSEALRHKICSNRWDMVLVTGRDLNIKNYLNDLWGHLFDEGLLVVDYISFDPVGKVFHEFCRVKNREPITFETRNGVGLVKR